MTTIGHFRRYVRVTDYDGPRVICSRCEQPTDLAVQLEIHGVLARGDRGELLRGPPVVRLCEPCVAHLHAGFAAARNTPP